MKLFSVLVMVGACDNKPADVPTTAAAASKPPVSASVPDGPPIEVTAAKLYADYAKDDRAADAAYLHHPMVVTGIIGGGTDAQGSTWREFVAAGGGSHVTIWFAAPEDASEPKKNDIVTVRCASVSVVDVPTLRDCKIDADSKPSH